MKIFQWNDGIALKKLQNKENITETSFKWIEMMFFFSFYLFKHGEEPFAKC